MIKWFFCILVVLTPAPLYAYLGPGMAGGAIAAVVGLIFAIFLAIFSILYFPIKRAIKKNATKKKDSLND